MAILLQGAGCRSARSCAAAYREAATWLEANALPQESIAVAEAAGRCFGERTVQTLPATTDALALLRAVDDGRPDYVLAEDGIAWDGAAAQPWFLARYRAVEAWHLGGTPARGSVLFAYTPTPTDGQPMVAAPARFLTDAVVLRGLRASSSRIGPDEPLHLTLLWDDVPGRPYQTLHVAVRLVDQATDTVWAHAAPPLVPAGVALEDEARLAQEVVLHPPESLPQGDYVVAVSLTEPSGRPVDVSGRAAAGGYGMALAAVTNPPDVSAQPIAMEYDVTATFGSADTPQIKLLGYDAPDRAGPLRRRCQRTITYWCTLYLATMPWSRRAMACRSTVSFRRTRGPRGATSATSTAWRCQRTCPAATMRSTWASTGSIPVSDSKRATASGRYRPMAACCSIDWRCAR